MATEVALTLVHDSTALWPESIMEVLTDSESTRTSPGALGVPMPTKEVTLYVGSVAENVPPAL